MSLKCVLICVSCTIFLGLCIPLAGQHNPSSPAQISQITSEETALHALVEQYLEAYAKKDIDGMMAFWSPNAPDMAARRKLAQFFFASSSKITLTHIELHELLIESEKAQMLVTFDLSAVDVDTGLAIPALGKITRSLECVKEAGLWKVWRDSDATADLARLLASKSEQERTALLNRNVMLVTPLLVDDLIDEARELQIRGENEAALSVHETAYGIASAISDKHGMARSLNNIGGLESLAGKYAEALQTLNKALALANTLDDKTMAGRILSTMGAIYLSQGNYSLALEDFLKELQISESIGSKFDIAFGLNDVGEIYLQQNDFGEALRYFQRSLEVSRKMGDKRMIARNLIGAGWVYQNQGDLDKALEQFREALTFSEQLGAKPLIANLLYSLGNVFLSQKDYQQAVVYFDRSLKLREAIGDQSIIAYALDGMAEAHYAQRNFEMALDFANRASAIARNTGDAQILWYSRGIAGQAYEALHKPIEARGAFGEAITVVENIRENVAGGEEQQQSFFKDKLAPYHGMIEVLLAESRLSEALSYAERAKGRTLADVLGNGRVNVTKAMTAAEREREEEFQAQLVSFNRQLGVARAAPKRDEGRFADLTAGLEKVRLQYSDFRTNLYAAHPELRAQRGQIESISLTDAARLLPDNRTAVLEFVVADEKSYLFVLTQKPGKSAVDPELQVHTIDIKAKDLGREAEELRRQLSLRDLQFRSSALRLFDLLVRPAQSQLSGIANLLIVPDGPLWNLPFQALQPRPGHYLLEDYALSYAPSLTTLREMARLRVRNRDMHAITADHTLMAMANPVLATPTSQRAKLTYRDENLSPLPETAREVKTLERLYGRQQSKVFVGAEATEDRFKAEAGEFRILHLATHGLLNEMNPMYSHVLLSSGGENPKEDGLLEAWEIMQMDLKADLAVLSACETARGRITNGEGVIGLTWAFFVAGVPTTVVSQWKVESESTSKLMLSLHQMLKSGDSRAASGFATATALQRAELQLLHDQRYSHPFYWAGFVVVGDPQ